MGKNICIIDGHPDGDPERLIHGLCEAYRDGAVSAGATVTTIRIADLNVQPLNSVAAFTQMPDPRICEERDKISAADHILLAFPLWLGSMPAATRAFFEQAGRGAFFLDVSGGEHKWPRKLMKGKSIRVVVTMGMPAFVYRTLMAGASLKALERGLLGISGFKPIKHTILGGVDATDLKTRKGWLSDLHQLGERGI